MNTATTPDEHTEPRIDARAVNSPDVDNYLGLMWQSPLLSPMLQEVLDKTSHAFTARLTRGISPSSVAGAFLDWAVHLGTSPGKQLQLIDKARRKSLRLLDYSTRCLLQGSTGEPCIAPLPQDKRFQSPSWQKWPFNLLHQTFLMQQQWWYNAATEVGGVTKQHERVVEFVTRQQLDVFSPSNYLLTNPEILTKTLEEGGQNLKRGWDNFIEDWQRLSSGRKPAGLERFKVGENLAITPGEVVYRNRLVELIRYHPTTDQVRPEPVFIVPAWIMKYYILDLSPHNSLVKYLTDQGFSVFILSWKNPDSQDSDLGMDDYRRLGINEALNAITTLTGQTQVHGMGYCLGGTLLTIAAAAFARDQRDVFKSLTLLAAQADFTEAGELTLFIDESQVAFLEDMMWEQGYLDTTQMAGAFQLLRSNDLIWSRLVNEYLMGERPRLNDLMAWNADATRMPHRMHSEYLRQLFLDNDLASGRYRVDGRPISITDIRAPLFAVGTENDHVAPWKSVYKLHLMADAELTFLLAKGGHNAGIVSEPGHDHRHYRVSTQKIDDFYRDPDRWLAETPPQPGSWWPELVRWLNTHSGDPIAPPPMAAPAQNLPSLGPAPGTYVHQP